MAILTDIKQSAKETARASADEQRTHAASALGDLAGALRKAAGELEGDRQAAGSMARWAADGLERASSTLGGKDVSTILREMESFARAQPLAFFGATLAAGFLATRFMRSSADEPQPPTRV